MSMFRIVRQLFLALVVVLGLALVGPVGTASADSGLCDASNGYTKPGNGADSGTLTNQSWGSMSWGGHTVTYTVNDGYEIGFCYKAGTFVDETVITGPASGTWTVTVQQGISHVGFQIISTPPDVQKDASFTKSISAATCATGEVLTYSGSNVTFSGPASGVTGPKSAADATVTATPISGHAWSDGTKTARTVSNVALAGPLDADSADCAAKDATAAVSVSPPSCDSAGVASVTGLANASLDGTLDQSVGAHTATFTADSGHRFADGSKTKDVPYTIQSKLDADSDACASQDATADVSVSPPSSDSAGVASVTGLANASLDGTLDQSVGAHSAHFVADSGHRFAGGSKTKDVPYTIASKIDADDDQCAVHNAAADVIVTEPGCDSASTAMVTGLSFATLDGTLDQSVGAHTAHFLADSGHRFADGSKTKDVPYTIASKIDADDDQ